MLQWTEIAFGHVRKIRFFIFETLNNCEVWPTATYHYNTNFRFRPYVVLGL